MSTKKSKGKSNSVRAGLVFPVGRVHRMMKEESKMRVSQTAAVYLAAVLEYMNAEVVELAGNAARDNKRQRVTPRDISLAVKNDEELNKAYKGSIAQGGVMPNINSALLPPKKAKRAKKGAACE